MAEKKQSNRITAGAVARALFPDTAQTLTDNNALLKRHLDAGNIAKAFGASTRNTVALPLALANDALVRPVVGAAQGIGGVLRDVFSGAFGDETAARAPALAARAAPTKPASPKAAVAQALQQGGAAVQQITPQERSMAAINSILSHPFTLKQFEAATGALPQVAAASGKQSRKDAVFGTAADTAGVLYQASLAHAGSLTDPAAQDEARLAATEAYRKNLLETLGIDPSKQALAQILAQQSGE